MPQMYLAVGSKHYRDPNGPRPSARNDAGGEGLPEQGFFQPVVLDSAQYAHEAGAGDNAGYQGLCSDCDEREECDIPKHFGGAWRCASYRSQDADAPVTD